MAYLKNVADIITMTRGFLAFVMVWIGIVLGKLGLSQVVYIMLICWTGDFFDGRIARMSRTQRQTWIGDHDIQVDLFVSLGLGAYLIWSGYINKIVAAGYILFWVLFFLSKGPDRNLLMLFQAPIYFFLIMISLQDAPVTGKWILAWLVIILSVNWKTFSKEIVPNFVSGFLELFKNNGASKIS